MFITATLVVSISTAILIGAGSAGTWSIWWSTHRNPLNLAREVEKLTQRVQYIEKTLKQTNTADPPGDDRTTSQTNQGTNHNDNASVIRANDDNCDTVDVSNEQSKNGIPLKVRHQSASESIRRPATPVNTHAEKGKEVQGAR